MEPKLKSETYSQLSGINTKASPYATGPFEFLNLVNYDFSTPGSLTKREGSTQYVSGTLAGSIGGLYEFNRLSGFSQLIVGANTNLYYISGSNFVSVKSGTLNNGIWDFVTFVDRLFACEGLNLLVYDGVNTRNFSLPPGPSFTASLSGTVSGFTGLFQYSYGYLNDVGYYGPAINTIGVSVAGTAVGFGLTAPAGYGISGIVVYRSTANGSALFGVTTLSAATTQFTDTNLSLGTLTPNDNLQFTLTPKYLEINNNRLHLAGFSGMLSTFYISDVGMPESIPPENFVEVRTNDGDKITGLRTYSGNMIIFKEKSFHALSGDSPENFLLTQVSDQYGCLSNRAIVQYEDVLWFLDRKGIVEFNGANIRIMSDKIQPIFDTMNIDAAKETAVAIHNRRRNELWFSIPCDGATFNNCTVVFDYLAQSWTTFKGFFPSTVAVAKQTFSYDNAFYGTYSGVINAFGASLAGDNGVGMTTIMKTRFFADMGRSTTEQYRRFFVDLDPVLGFTSALSVNFFTDYGASIQLTRTMYQSPFQSRIDFGLPAKSLAAEIINTTNTDPIKIHGFTIESREQRKV